MPLKFTKKPLISNLFFHQSWPLLAVKYIFFGKYILVFKEKKVFVAPSATET